MGDSLAPCVDRWLGGNEVELGTTLWKEPLVCEPNPNPSYNEPGVVIIRTGQYGR